MKQTRWWVSEDSETKNKQTTAVVVRVEKIISEEKRRETQQAGRAWKEKKRQRDEDNEEERRSGRRPAAAAEDHEMQGASTKRVIYNRCRVSNVPTTNSCFFPHCLIGWLASFYFRYLNTRIRLEIIMGEILVPPPLIVYAACCCFITKGHEILTSFPSDEEQEIIFTWFSCALCLREILAIESHVFYFS